MSGWLFLDMINCRLLCYVLWRVYGSTWISNSKWNLSVWHTEPSVCYTVHLGAGRWEHMLPLGFGKNLEVTDIGKKLNSLSKVCMSSVLYRVVVTLNGMTGLAENNFLLWAWYWDLSGVWLAFGSRFDIWIIFHWTRPSFSFRRIFGNIQKFLWWQVSFYIELQEVLHTTVI